MVRSAIMWKHVRLQISTRRDPVSDTEPIPWCLGHKPTKMCLEAKTTELPPGEQ
jgi:hypothetical protein